MPRDVSNWPANEALPVFSQSAEERTATSAPDAVRRVYAATSPSASFGSSGARSSPSLTSRASRRAWWPSAAAATAAAGDSRPNALMWARYPFAVRHTASGTRRPACASRASVAALGPTAARGAAPTSLSETKYPSASRANDQSQDRFWRALVLGERGGRGLERIRAADEPVDVDRAGGNQSGGRLEIGGRERPRADEGQLLHVHGKHREVGHRTIADPVDEEPPARPQHLDGGPHQLRRAGGVDDQIGSLSLGHVEDGGDYVLPSGVHHVISFHPASHRELGRTPRNSDDQRRARMSRELGMHKAGRALAEHDHPLAGGDTCPLLRVTNGRQCLDQRH